MKFLKSSMLSAAAVIVASQASAVDLEVTHWWTSGGEAAAVSEFAKAFDATEHTWIDGAIAGSGGTARPIIISRILGGDPMHATQLSSRCNHHQTPQTCSAPLCSHTDPDTPVQQSPRHILQTLR